jgi:hypothetical protein
VLVAAALSVGGTVAATAADDEPTAAPGRWYQNSLTSLPPVSGRPQSWLSSGAGSHLQSHGIDTPTRLGRYRWKAERTIAWLFGHRRLRIRYDVCDERFYAFVLLASALICYRTLTNPPW